MLAHQSRYLKTKIRHAARLTTPAAASGLEKLYEKQAMHPSGCEQDAPTLNAPTKAGIDILRGLFSMLVLVAHSWEYAFYHIWRKPELLDTKSFRILDSSIGKGGFWVAGFFVISGFCIHLSALNSRAASRYAVSDYLKARLTRIYPLFFIGLILALVIHFAGIALDNNPIAFPWIAFICNIFVLQGFNQPFPGYGQSWSITYEIVYYLAWPLVLHLFGWTTAAVKAGISAMFLTLIFGSIWYFFFDSAIGSIFIPLYLIPFTSILWLGGTLLSTHWNCLLELHHRSSILRALCGASVILLAGAYLFHVWLIYHHSRALILAVAGYLFLPVFCILIFSLYFNKIINFIPKRFVEILGSASYPIYLFHLPILSALAALVKYFDLSIHPLSGFFILSAITLCVTIVCGVPLEERIMKWRQARLHRRPAH